MPHYICWLRATRPELLSSGPTPEEAAVLARHDAYLADLHARGAVVLAGRTEPADYPAYKLVVLRAGSESEARQLVSGDPAVLERTMRAELYALRVTLSADSRDLA